MMDKRRVLFICQHNDVRSPMAEALLRNMRPDSYEVFSAGIEPTDIHPAALERLDHMHIDATGLRSKSVHDFEGVYFDYVICLLDKGAGEYARLVDMGEFLIWNFEDPTKSGRKGPFMKTLEELRRRIQMFLLVTERNSEVEGTELHILQKIGSPAHAVF